MAVEIVMPRFGWTMEEGVLVEWMKRDGDAVKAGELLFTVEGDKALNEVESFDTGTLRLPPDLPTWLHRQGGRAVGVYYSIG